ncbi:Molybdenum cofactor sulfurase [Cordyceps fumosorosea ARSEF 2679]|uniref:Molybdenum cofactor sulfurase n=1 Tax=Cordyceps fumosorosea (strain ARSEF 2679) TaxID=1081104 RepID=A0A168AK52_CORFA|nr:Molybdenum cofactor sulfurase [Cordyceps fumosorosea ARSEF 2679]OAA68858.1 Molybdenum cofactor sulfurase [Cordyceps fumosorosea ARSEF 2679]
MKITALYVYPVKALRGISLDAAELGGQGLRHDRTFMLCRFGADRALIPMQMSEHADCALFHQEMVDGPRGRTVRVRYGRPAEPVAPHHELQDAVLEFSAEPETDGLERAEVNLHQSLVHAYRVGSECDDWFAACFGFEVTLLYIGRERRPVLGTFSPRNPPVAEEAPQTGGGWLPYLSGFVPGLTKPAAVRDEPDWLTFSDMAPLLLTTEASLRNVRARFASGDEQAAVDMCKFRPNIVVDGGDDDDDAWDEDFWAALSVNGAPALLLTKLCNRCTSLNVDYATGRFSGGLLKALMRDRRVDEGWRYAPVFGRYGFLDHGVAAPLRVAVGDEVAVTMRAEERPRWDWPMRPKPGVARYYRYA